MPRAHGRCARENLRAVLRNPALRRVLLGYLLFNAVEFDSWVALLVYAYTAVGPTSVGRIALAQLLPASLFAAVSSSLADQFPRHRVLLGGTWPRRWRSGARTSSRR